MITCAGSADRALRALTLAIALLTAVPAAQAAIPVDLQPSQVLHQHYGRAQGLPAEMAWSVMQDRDGYVWIGTQNGLARYDGVRFTVFSSRENPAFGADDVRVVVQAPDGRIWAGTYGGGVVVGDAAGFEAITRADGLVGDIVYDIHFAADGATWFATASGVSRLADGEFTSWTAAEGLAADRVFRIAEDADGVLWFATLTGGLSAFDGQGFVNFTTEDGLDSPQVHLLMRDGERLLAGSYNGGLYRAELDGLEPLERGELARSISAISGLRDRHGQMWLGSYGSGLWRWTEGGKAEHFELPSADPTHIFDLLQGREGELWLATINGLHRLHASPFQPWGRTEGLSDFTFVVLDDPTSGAVWAGVENAGLFRIDQHGSIDRFGTEQGLQHPSVSALAIDREGTLWVGTFGGGVHRWDDGRLIPATWNDSLPGQQVYAMLGHSDGSIWVATENGTARILDDGMQVLRRDDGLPGDLVRAFLEGRDGAVWMASPEGLARLDDDGIRTWDSSDGLADPVISALHEDPDGAIWAGMRSGGLARLADDGLVQFGTGHGLPQASVFAIVADHGGDLWLSGAAGLVHVQRQQLMDVVEGRAETFQARLFDEADGLRSSRFMVGFQPAGARAADGKLWFPTNRGLISFDPSDIEPPRLQGDLLIERILVDSVPVQARAPLILPPETRSLEIEYTVARMLAPERVRFHYRLGDQKDYQKDYQKDNQKDNQDTPWQAVGDRRTAYFTNLPPGAQRFGVQATLEGVVDDSTQTVLRNSLDLVRQPYWFEQFRVRIGGVLVGLLLVGLLVRILLRREKRRRRMLEILVERRTAELRQALGKVETLSRIDGLTGLANRRHFDERLERILGQAAEKQLQVGLMMIDIDHFKDYNDSHGHVAGDECLRKVAGVLDRTLTRDNDLVGRYGGEEFALALHDTDCDHTGRIAERIRTSIEALELDLDDPSGQGRITVSIGWLCRVPAPDQAPEDLVRQADRALYQAKHQGRNRCVEADPTGD